MRPAPGSSQEAWSGRPSSFTSRPERAESARVSARHHSHRRGGGRRLRLGRRPHRARRRGAAHRSGRRARNGKKALRRLGADRLHRLRLRRGLARELGEVDALPGRPAIQAAAQESPGVRLPRHATRAHRREVWVRVEGNKGRQSGSIHPRWPSSTGSSTDHPQVRRTRGEGGLWWYDSPSGTVIREAEQNGPEHRIRVTRFLPTQGGPCLSSITISRRKRVGDRRAFARRGRQLHLPALVVAMPSR